jgi:hypothetical protein
VLCTRMARLALTTEVFLPVVNVCFPANERLMVGTTEGFGVLVSAVASAQADRMASQTEW